MRSIRTAAVAGATALAMALGTTAATAQTEDEGVPSTPTDNVVDTVPPEDSANYKTPNDPENPSLSSQIGRGLERDEATTATALFGEDSNLSSEPAWAQAFAALTAVVGIGSLVGLVVGPIHNFIVHGPQF